MFLFSLQDYLLFFCSFIILFIWVFNLATAVFVMLCGGWNNSAFSPLLKQPDSLITVETFTCFSPFTPRPDKPICHPHDQLVAESDIPLLSEHVSDGLWLPQEMVTLLSWRMAPILQVDEKNSRGEKVNYSLLIKLEALSLSDVVYSIHWKWKVVQFRQWIKVWSWAIFEEAKNSLFISKQWIKYERDGGRYIVTPG